MLTSKDKAIPRLANLIPTLAPGILRGILSQGKRLESALSEALPGPRSLNRADRRLVLRSIGALVRWWGWIEPLRLIQAEEQLLLAWLLDSSELHGLCRLWARKLGRDTGRLYLVGDAPNWTARADGLKRFVEGKPVTADPWMLFPAWLRDQLPNPPGEEPTKARRLRFLQSLQTRFPVWLGVRQGAAKATWTGLREAGLTPWVHRRLESAARVDPDTNIAALPAYHEGSLVIEDLSSQALGVACDPDPGERWWDAVAGQGLHAIHLASLMEGKGTIVATQDNEAWRRETAVRIRRGPFRNIAVKVWDGRHPPGKPGSFDGVLVDAPCSGVGTWRRHPDARWIVGKDEIPRLAETQGRLLQAAAGAVRPGGSLIYSVATCTLAETTRVIEPFLAAHPEFRLEPFPHPLEEATTTGMVYLWPHLHDTEARFIARMIRVPSA